MIPLMRTLNRIEEYERRFATALECYIAAVGGMEENAVPVCGDLLGQHQSQLRVLRKRMQADPRPEVLAECRARVAASPSAEPRARWAAAVIIVLWLAAGGLLAYLVYLHLRQ